MPRRSNFQADCSALMDSSKVYDIDNVYLSDRGWAYRHYTNRDKSTFWDEVLVAGEVPSADSPDPFGDATPTFQGAADGGDDTPSIDIPEITDFSVALDTLTPQAGVAANAQSSLEGTDLAGATYQWSSSDASAVFGTATAANTTVEFSEEGTFTLSCVVSIAYGAGSDAISATAHQFDIVVSAPA